MSSLFAGLKEKFADKLAEFKASTALQDPNDKHAAELVDAATSDELIAPDWNLNLNVVDFVNSDLSQNSGRTLKALKRNLAKCNTKVQLLSLTLLEGCVKNCSLEFHQQLATSDLWTDVVKLAEDTSITRVDAEVRDKVLGMVEDFSRFLQPSQFQTAYESLLNQGVDFPVRTPDDAASSLTPPASVAAVTAAAPVAAAAAGGNASAAVPDAVTAVANPTTGADAAAADPLAGLDEQDRVAIQAALAEFEAEARAAQEAARVADEADAEERRQQQLMQQQQQQQTQLLMRQQEQQQATMEAEAALGLLAAAQTVETGASTQATATAATVDTPAMGVPVPGVPISQAPEMTDPRVAVAHRAQPQQPQADAQAGEEPEEVVAERVARLLETASNSTLLLSEMLASVPDSEPFAVREPYVAEVADTCVRLRSRLERHLVTLSDEALLASALSQHDELSRVLQRYDELLAAAEAVAPTVPRNAAAVAMSHAAAGRGAGRPAAQPHSAHGDLQPHSFQPHHSEQAAGTETTGQKVAAVAAALKERFTGAFDKLIAAARAPGGGGGGSGAVPVPAPGAAAVSGATALGGSAGVTPTAAVGSGAFTLLDDEDEEANEGTSLITKRTSQQGHQQFGAAGAGDGAAPQLHLQQLLHEAMAPVATPAATAAAPPPLPPPAPPAAADLINFDEEETAPAQAAAAAPPAAVAAPSAVAPTLEEAQRGTPPAVPATGLDDLLSGLTIHAATPAADPAAREPAAAATAAAPPAPALRSAGGSAGDQLVEALDRLVSLSSGNASPSPGVEALAEGAGAFHPQPPQQRQQQQQ